ncbi:DNA-directed RNA polymerase I subunit RPA34 A34.5 [Collichthys lucidus]|uniref:DNA-directed RNA polymerase I subunit RPA34 A34.5 n=1 Tax=Collichthys lucidus TaxID=240159 RepID=A0A4U5UZ34_COLLU|nr:DNA-directed RNA polymerase I subunit RPA34 A34.5 [Collichthys lucidus]
MPKDISSSSEDEAGSPPAKSALKQKESGGGVSSAPTAQKPNRFQCPADFVSFCHKPCSSTLTESLKNNKNELWLIKAPASFNPECFSGIKVPLSGLQTLKVPAAAGGVKTGSGQQIYSVLASTHVTSELCLLTSEEESSSGVVFGPTFSGLLNVCESYGDSSANQAPQVIPADPAPSIPPGLKQRFHPFGSKTPTLTCVAETQTDGASSATPRSLPGKRLIGETKQEDEDEEEGRKKKKKKKKEKRIKTEQGEEPTEEVRVKEEPVTEIEDQATVEEGDVLEEKRKKKKKKKDREREEVEEGVENCVKMEEVTVKCEPTDTLDVAEDSAKKKKKKKKKSKTDDD